MTEEYDFLSFKSSKMLSFDLVAEAIGWSALALRTKIPVLFKLLNDRILMLTLHRAQTSDLSAKQE